MDDTPDNHPEGGDDHAVVLGAGLAGLLSARVLARRFARVTIVERDELPEDGPEFRPGVPQSRHVHVLWSRGLELIERLLPGITDELTAGGSTLLETPRDFLWLSTADWFRQVPGARQLVGSRDLIDWTVRRAVLREGEGRIRVVAGRLATGLLAGADGRTVAGVVLRGGDGPAAPAERLAARLVVDATGRASKTPAWLAALGHPAPAVTRYDAHLGYSSRTYAIPKGPERRWQGMYVQGRPDSPRGGVLVPLDGDRWMVTLIGNGEHAPPTKDPEFLDFARRLRSPALHDALRAAEPLSEPTGFRGTANEWRHYERLDRWPDGLLVVGDALCRFNPVYGHGMTVAALGAEALDEALSGLTLREIPAAARRVQRRTAAVASVAWQIATSEDLRYPGTEGPPPDRATRVLQRYMSRVVVGANADPAVSASFFGVLSLSAPPNTLLSPWTMLRVLSKWRLPSAPSTSRYPPHHLPRETA
ncbi:FAD-dependent monooxygenase [Streptomyces sp. NBC_00249]|uniref:FAD-dependent oxidoreductase n=1 Tax=Streptomyces sp. NBC_00249 TaxID=2975690 RepID=UPI00224D699C|nr:FAD-dependent oxidoreductase [Streptomyces sp. NBC_00249]MCX5193628.1 FAD-dependent monooxygenase [Streptomyces sp. NBC_00249]